MLSGLLDKVAVINNNILSIAGQIRKPWISSCAPFTLSGMEKKNRLRIGSLSKNKRVTCPFLLLLSFSRLCLSFNLKLYCYNIQVIENHWG